LILSVSRRPQPVVSSNEVSVLRYCTCLKEYYFWKFSM
jgi:hypothetical protein